MAKLIPDIDPNEIPFDSERLVYLAFRELPSGYVVMHSFPWLRPRRDLANEPLTEGEADFVVLHAERGLLVVEVKGGIPELRSRTWFRNGQQMRDPFEQARRNRYALLDAIEERTSRRIHRNMFTHGDLVIFPHCRFAGPLPLNTDPRIFVDAGLLSSLTERLELAWTAWRRSSTFLSAAQFGELLDALMPKLRLLRCVGAELALEGTKILQVTEDQQATLQGLLANDRILIEGTAGSGKTLLALEFAVRMAASGKRVLLLCFNRHLAAWIGEQVLEEPRLRGRRELLEVSTFHSLAIRIARRAGVEFDIPEINSSIFWDEEVPLILEQALEIMRIRGDPVIFDAVIVDEAQDFSRDWWVTIESMTRDGRKGRLCVFLDRHQGLRGDAELPPVSLAAKFVLSTNCRNTRSIARSASRLVGAEVTLLPGSPEGEAPSLFRSRTSASQAGIVLGAVRDLLRAGVPAKGIALIGPAAYENGSLGSFEEIEGIPLISDASSWRRGEGILVSTARAFKGLEADAVVIYDLATFSAAFARNDLYVAWTRARHRLIVVCHGAELRASIEDVLAQTERMIRSAGSQ